jgi:hypothetical protein
MSLPRWIQKSLVIPAGAAILMVSAGSAQAQSQRELFSWSGTVDREVHLTMRGRIARMQGSEWSGEDRGRFEVVNTLPQAAGFIGVRVEDGRGDVDVIQQPSAQNDYTTVIRIRDESGGSDRYHIRALWFGGDDRDGREGVGRGRIGEGRGGRIGDRDDPWYGPGRGNDARNAMFWSGSVDGVLEIRIRGNRVDYRTVSGRAVQNVRVEMPRRGNFRPNMPLRVQWAEGRGTVRVIQQPTPRNGQTTVIRISDPQGGYGRYAFELIPSRMAAAGRF